MPNPGDPQAERVVAYIDGLNVYQGLVGKGWRDLLWLDYGSLVESFLLDGQTIVAVKYFTAPRTSPLESYHRQLQYFQALDAVGGLTRIEGSFDRRKAPCTHCGRITEMPRERATDVNLATHLVADAAQDRYDVALLLTGDSDYLSPIAAARELGKRVKLLRPAGRRGSNALSASVDHLRDIGRADLARNQLPDPVVAGNRTINCPFAWLDLDAKISRLSAGHQAYLRTISQGWRTVDLQFLHPLANELWRRENRSQGPNAV